MTVKVRFFAQFRELLGTDIVAEPGKSVADLIRSLTKDNGEGYRAIFDEKGTFRKFVIVMRNGKRLGNAEVESTVVADGDEIAVFPPVAGG